MKIEGRNSVLEALNSSSVTVNSLTCVKGDNGSVVAQARSQGVKITYVDKSVLDKESASGKHQGYIADIVDYDYCDVSDILACSAEPFVVVLDGINDPHNFGSIIRCCECAGVDGIIIGRNRQVAVTDTVVRCSAGAAAHVKIARVTNVNNAIKQLKEKGVWVLCIGYGRRRDNVCQSSRSGCSCRRKRRRRCVRLCQAFVRRHSIVEA